jgi:hypothetical protein
MLLNRTENVEILENMIEHEKVPADVTPRFSINQLHEKKNFLSLLYYLGLVTVGKDEKSGDSILKIPNYSIKTMYWEYMERMIMERNPEMSYLSHVIYGDLMKMANYGDYRPFFEHFQQNFVACISNRDLQHFSEKNVKFLLLSIFIENNVFQPLSEAENTAGYADLYLRRRDELYPRFTTDWVVELKYIKQADADDEKLFAAKKAEAVEQLHRYRSSVYYKDRTDIRYLAVVFTGKNGVYIEEV